MVNTVIICSDVYKKDKVLTFDYQYVKCAFTANNVNYYQQEKYVHVSNVRVYNSLTC